MYNPSLSKFKVNKFLQLLLFIFLFELQKQTRDSEHTLFTIWR